MTWRHGQVEKQAKEKETSPQAEVVDGSQVGLEDRAAGTSYVKGVPDPRLALPANLIRRAGWLRSEQRAAGNALLQRVLERPARLEPGPAAGREQEPLTQQAAPPRAALRAGAPAIHPVLRAEQPSLQRRALAPRNVQDVELGVLRVGSQDEEGVGLGEPIPMRATTEVVPAAETASRFRGFATEREALSHALLQPDITALVQDGEGFVHVLNVSENRPIAEETTSEPIGQLTHFRVLRFVNPAIPTPATVIYGEMPEEHEEASWAGRVRRARRLHSQCYPAHARADTPQGREVARAYQGLAAEAFHVAPDQIHIMFGLGETPDIERINIMLDPAGQAAGTSGIGQEQRRENEPFALYPTRSAASQRPWVLVSWTSFTEEGPMEARGVLRHESSHEATTERVRGLMETWETQGRPQGDFWTWLQGQERLRDGGPHRVTSADIELALARVYVQSDEPIACTSRFTTVYHQVPAGRITDDVFSEVSYMLAHWAAVGTGMGTGASHIRSLGEVALARLQSYYLSLDREHQDAFDRWLDRLPASDELIRPAMVGSARWSLPSVQAAIGQMRTFRSRRRR